MKTNQGLFLRVRITVLISFLLITGFTQQLHGQDEPAPRRGSRVIDDTTRQVYGPHTTKFFFEEDFFYNKYLMYPNDTLIRNFHRFTYVERNQYLYQDLGNIGTAARPIFYRVPSYIGVSTGFESFDLYWEAERIKYYDTRSPYVNMKLVLAKGGRSMTNVTYSRNINPRWNFGFNYRGIFVDKQVQRRGKGDRHVRSTYYDLFTTFISKDSTYRVFANFARNMYQVDEYGGILQNDLSFSGLFLVNASPRLTEAESRELRTRFHLHHQYEIGRALQVYHRMDRYRQGNQFFDFPRREPSYDFDAFVIPGDSTRDRATMRTFRNEAGVKGNISKIFYNGYVAIRHYSMHYKYRYFNADTLNIPIPAKGDEHYLGGRIALQLDSLMELRGWAEVMADGNYRIEGRLSSKWLEGSLKQNQYAPPFLHQAYRGSHDEWENSFANTQATQLAGRIHYRSKVMTISPGVIFTRLRNYTFFDYTETLPEDSLQEVLPVQSSGNQIIASPEATISMTFLRNVNFTVKGIYTELLENADDAIRVPRLFVNSQLSYSNIFFNGNLDMHAGVDLHWHSAYYAPAYDPVIQQFYNQDFYRVPAVPIVDIFFNAKIKRGRIFVKYHNIFQKFNDYGYIPTPFYPGQKNVIDFGFDWSFYD